MDPSLPAVAAAIRFLSGHDDERPTPAATGAAGLDTPDMARAFTRLTGAGFQTFRDLLAFTDGRALLHNSRQCLNATPAASVTLEVLAPRRSYAGLVIRWGRHDTVFGAVLAAATDAGLCRLGFDGNREAPDRLVQMWPGADLIEDAAATRKAVARAFDPAPAPRTPPLALAPVGTPFQAAVWRALLTIPSGAVLSYQDVGALVGRPSGARAVGGAVGANPIAVLIPCHRVIAGSGALHQFGWGPPLKRALIAWERARAGYNPSTSAIP